MRSAGLLFALGCAPRAGDTAETDTDGQPLTWYSSYWTPDTNCRPDGPLRLTEVHADCADGTFLVRVGFEGCPRAAGLEIVGGDPVAGEDHRPFHDWGRVLWHRRRPSGTLRLALDTEARHWRPSESTSYACDALAPTATPGFTFAVWLTDFFHDDLTVCRAWGPDTGPLLDGAFDDALRSVDLNGIPEDGAPPPGGWSSCGEIPDPTAGTVTHTGHSAWYP